MKLLRRCIRSNKCYYLWMSSLFIASYYTIDLIFDVPEQNRTVYHEDVDFTNNLILPDIWPINEDKQSDDVTNITVHLVAVACMGKHESTLPEVITMIKSAVLFARSRIHVHIFTINLKERIIEEVGDWPLYFQDKFILTIHELVYPLDKEELDEMRDWWGPCASFRLFLPTTMPDVDAVLYVDIDVIFLSPIDDVWSHFLNFDPEQVGGLSPRVGWDFHVPESNPNFISKPDQKMTQINSGVFLMNLTRMRKPSFRTDPEISNELHIWDKNMLLPLYKQHIHDMYSDQSLINVVFHYNPALLYLIPCKFNYHHKFCFDAYSDRFCESAEKEGAAVVHGNANTFYNDYSPAFKAVNNVMKEYNFESDLFKYLLQPITTNLRHPSVEHHEHCGNKTELFLKQLTKSVKELMAEN